MINRPFISPSDCPSYLCLIEGSKTTVLTNFVPLEIQQYHETHLGKTNPNISVSRDSFPFRFQSPSVVVYSPFLPTVLFFQASQLGTQVFSAGFGGGPLVSMEKSSLHLSGNIWYKSSSEYDVESIAVLENPSSSAWYFLSRKDCCVFHRYVDPSASFSAPAGRDSVVP